MSVCPHPRPPVERCVGEACELVCPDCHERLASVEVRVASVDGTAKKMSAKAIQKVYDQAFAEGILEAPAIYDPGYGVTAARIEDGVLVETVAG